MRSKTVLIASLALLTVLLVAIVCKRSEPTSEESKQRPIIEISINGIKLGDDLTEAWPNCKVGDYVTLCKRGRVYTKNGLVDGVSGATLRIKHTTFRAGEGTTGITILLGPPSSETKFLPKTSFWTAMVEPPQGEITFSRFQLRVFTRKAGLLYGQFQLGNCSDEGRMEVFAPTEINLERLKSTH